ncbi:hypothetical protein PGT21_020124 [Puccinia graminis f. sp. tritici]|uniref:ZP domain-containing protein n=1 Tax=Puccinia graminis f. sp. tritici TaxID=56615 RepID=A0A5B0P1H3_PUCGR|nr:hypothetical protein PGTUg99_031296 [Puccinia graminis f. sp. tritici]KAA1099773.1 hypothetical protein PGT21_020124 [Puccinia graminis f. sp. tritici]KAA1137977.1 hypothetical protein PGTUg99_017092 [Puccinia graminis f. sp. tritici]
MVLHRVIFIAVICLLNAPSSLQLTKPVPLTDIKCSKKRQLRPGDCARAYQKIIYDTDLTLDQSEITLEKVSGSCVTRIDNPKFLNVPKEIIEDAFNQVVTKCDGVPGHANLTSFDGVRVLVRHHTRPSVYGYEDDTELNQSICFRDSDTQDIVEEDCMEAYRLLPTDTAGHFLSVEHHVQGNSIGLTFKTCLVSVWTSDGSKIIVLKGDMERLFGKLMQQCKVNGKGGTLITEGAQGKNGKVNLQVSTPKT